MSKTFFITGVDTDIGKTFVSVGLCLAYEKQKKKVCYYKPFQSGAYLKDNELVAPDIYELKKYSNNIIAKYSYLFKGEVSPHLASLIEKREINLEKIKSDLEELKKEFEIIIIEGAGGYYCPAFRGHLFSDVIKFLDEEIIIVTTPKLGRLNHLLMTLELAKINKAKIRGIIINQMPKKMTLSEENFIKELKLFNDTPILGVVSEITNKNKENIIEIFEEIIHNLEV